MKYMCGNIEVYIGQDLPPDIRFVVVFLKDKGHWVMGYHSVRKGWELPGGGIERGETIENAAIREAYEETGAVVEDVEIKGYYILPNGHKTAITTAEVMDFTLDGLNYEMEKMERYLDFPDDVTFKDGLYKFIADLIAPDLIPEPPTASRM